MSALGGRPSFAPIKNQYNKDCLPPGVEVIWVSGKVAKLLLTIWVMQILNNPFDGLKWESFQRLPMFYSTFVKIPRQAKTTDGNINYCPCSAQNFEAAGAAGENLRSFSFRGSDRLLRKSTQPWESIYREQTSSSKTNRMVINRFTDQTGGKKQSAKVRLDDSNLNHYIFIGYRNNHYFPHTNPYKYANRSSHVTMQRSTYKGLLMY